MNKWHKNTNVHIYLYSIEKKTRIKNKHGNGVSFADETEREGEREREKNKIVCQTIEDKAYKNVLDWSVRACECVCMFAQTNVSIKDMEIRYLF